MNKIILTLAVLVTCSLPGGLSARYGHHGGWGWGGPGLFGFGLGYGAGRYYDNYYYRQPREVVIIKKTDTSSRDAEIARLRAEKRDLKAKKRALKDENARLKAQKYKTEKIITEEIK